MPTSSARMHQAYTHTGPSTPTTSPLTLPKAQWRFPWATIYNISP